MLKKVTIAENSIDPQTWKEFETENVCEFLLNYFKEWPENARIYNKSVSELTDVTPSTVKEVEELELMEGPFYIVIYPAAYFQIIVLIISLIVLAVTLLNKPKIPTIALKNGDNLSPNNGLSGRSNKERINSRIPDIYGQVRSIPDLIMQSYAVFIDNVEREHSYMCVGRGEFQIDDVKEDTTLISQIAGSSVEVYNPLTSPNSGDNPILRIGDSINTLINKVTRYSSVNGQVMAPESKISVNGKGNIKFTHDSKIVAASDSGIDFRILFHATENVIVTNAIKFNIEIPSHVHDIVYNLNGTYIITSVTQFEITVSNASSNSDWAHFISTVTDSSNLSPNLLSSTSEWSGPFTITQSDNTEIWCNFVALNGIYKDDGTTKTPFPVEISVRLTPVDLSNTPIGDSELFTATLLWNTTDNLSLGITLKAVPTFTGRCTVEAKRLTPATTISVGQISEEVKWRDLYSIVPITQTHFGDVTTVQTQTVASVDSLAITERKFNMLVTRKLKQRISGTTFSTLLYATKQVDEIISAICLDTYIGNRQLSEIDFDNIYSTIDLIRTYFGTVKASEFSYTFDSTNLSFEESISSIANTVFCIAYRRGNLIKLSFEKLNEMSTILFNHRNKIPGSEIRSISFGNVNDNDGIEYQYVDPKDDSSVTLYLPEDRSSLNPAKIESMGVRSYLQAYFNAKRLYNKIKYQTTSIEFEALAEANICVINDRILVSDGTRSGSLEGEVIAQNVLELELSQNINLLDGVEYTIFLQYKDGTVESIPITKTDSLNKVVLDRAPLMSLALDSNLFARTTFIITSNDDTRKTAFILTEKTPKGILTSEVKAVNYDSRYYQNDLDFINGIVIDA